MTTQSPYRIQTTDPRGQTVVCTHLRWVNHILAEHANMRGRESEVQRAIEQPVPVIYQDAQFSNRQVYYGHTTARVQYVKVVVEFEDDDEPGQVITAFVTDSGKSGEKPLWPD
jgi:hypothetical protein